MKYSAGIGAAALLAATAVGVPAAPIADAAPQAAKFWDFDGDGHRELVVGVPRATISGFKAAGAVGILYGTSTGPSAARWQRLDQARSLVPGTPSANEQFGSGVASGDFNADGYADLAVCTAQEGEPAVQSLSILFGSATGLTRAISVDPTAGSDDDGCRAVVAADFDRSGYPDLVVTGRLGVHVGRGGPQAGTTAGWQFQELAMDEMDGFNSPTTGDVNGDGYPDLAYKLFRAEGQGQSRLNIQLGGPTGFTAAAGITLDGGLGIALGDVNGDGFADAAFGQASTVGGQVGAGVVKLWYGSSQGVDFARTPVVISQNTSGVPGASEAGDAFGTRVALADTNGDRLADLAIGTPGEDLGSVVDAGLVTVIPGGSSGLVTSKTIEFHQDSAGVPDTVEAGDEFGRGLSYLDYTGDGRSELLVASPRENTDHGLVHLLKATSTGLTGAGALAFDPVTFHITAAGAELGSTL